MFAVIFEVNPKPEQWDSYLSYAKMLRPELERINGFIDNERFSSLRRSGWVLSLSIWRDEKAVIRWRTAARHHEVQQKGRNEVFRDYHLRVGWDVFESIYQPGKFVLLTSWRDAPAAAAWPAAPPSDDIRHRRIRVVRDYGMFNRAEAPQHFPPVTEVV